jgi:N-acyl homoserine lactone hydrolase
VDVRRVDFGYFVRPGSETADGHPRAEPVLGYLIDHPAGRLLVDTGMGAHPEVDAHYRPVRIPLAEALSRVGSRLDDIRYVVNCHLHFDHCGGNPQLPGRPVFVQSPELAAARHTADYTLPTLIDHAGARYEVLNGAETEILPDIHLLPTPGHSPGHQSVLITGPDGTLVVAGQSHDNATAFTTDVLNHRAHIATPPTWLTTLLSHDPKQVLFAHDNATWTP